MKEDVRLHYLASKEGEKGYLQLRVYLAVVGNPAFGAKITVYGEEGEVLFEKESDSVGLSETMALEAPPALYSQIPHEERPYRAVDVLVSYPHYEDVEIKGVQIYGGTLALQTVKLKPEAQEIVVPEPVLWGEYPEKIPEATVKPLPPSSDLMVLPEPVIPGLIVVHDGVPSDSAAKNYTVTFKDYIKNVASSEIYSTWHTAAIEANILAIQSFTLNRVYTEWYRGKGYDFTITSSTAYDQAFSYGRTIYEEISQAVDRLFTTYISRNDIEQPLFTQYCDGIKVSREGWLSQWGSEDLAKQGYSTLGILQRYYGYEIVLKEAPKVEGIPMSFPGEVLKVGSRGTAVETVQRQLNAIGNKFPKIAKIAVDGIYGSGTEGAVREFQGIFNLPVTGEVNFPTWYEISNIYVAVENLAS